MGIIKNNWPTGVNNCYYVLLKCEMPNNSRQKIISGDQTAVPCTNWRWSHFFLLPSLSLSEERRPAMPDPRVLLQLDSTDVTNLNTLNFVKHKVHPTYIVPLKIQFTLHSRLRTVNIHLVITRLLLRRKITPLPDEHHTNNTNTYIMGK